MNKLEYQPGIKGKAIQMDGPVAFVGTAENLRGREWSYELGYRGLTSATRAAREVDVDFFTDYATADALRRAADADVMGRTPGILVAQNEWKQRAYILSSSPNTIHFGRLNTTLNVALLDGAWWRLVSKSFKAANATATQYQSATGETVSTSGAAGAPLHSLTVYGESVQDGTPTPSAPVPVDTVSMTSGKIQINVTSGGVTTTTDIDLQGHVLASLPDGTQDVLTVDSVGHVILEKRVEIIEGGEAGTTAYYNTVNHAKAIAFRDKPYPAAISTLQMLSDRFVFNGAKGDASAGAMAEGLFGFYYTPSGSSPWYIYFQPDATITSQANVANWLSTYKPKFYYQKATPQTIDLGYIEMPSVSDGSVVSITADVTPTITAEWQVTPGLDYPHDYEHDYSETNAGNALESSVLIPSSVHIVVYGPAVNPYVIVGGNTYQVNVTVPAGGYLVIDGRDKTIVLTLADGTQQNAFEHGVRGSGIGGGSYVFEPLQPGSQSVAWDGSFGFDFGWYEEEGEPPWSQS